MSEVTVPLAATEVEYQITTSDAGPFVVPFVFFEQADVRVIKRDDATDIETELFLTTDWTYTTLNTPVGQQGVGYQSAELTLNVALVNHTLKIFRDTIIDRISNYPSTGPFAIYLLNNELARLTAICQELELQKSKYISLPDGSLDTTPFDAGGRSLCGLGESADDDCAATNRQVDANGPNWLEDNNAESAVGPHSQWNNIISVSGIKIEGNDATRLADVMTQFFAFLQNRAGAESVFYIRYRYQVDCYAEVAKIASAVYPVRIPPTTAIPFSFMDIEQDIDYTNGNCTLSVSIDIYPLGTNSGNMYMQWMNLAVNTSEPR